MMRRGLAVAVLAILALAGVTTGSEASPRINGGSAYHPRRPLGPTGRSQPIITNRVYGVPSSFGPRRVYGTPPQFGATYGAPPSSRVWNNPQNGLCRTCGPGERFPGIPYYGR